MIKIKNGYTEHEVDATRFPDKTTQVWKIPSYMFNEFAEIEWVFENESELLQIAQLKVLFESNGVSPVLFVPFLPYGRQDKNVSNTTTFALHAFAKLLNSLEFHSIVTIEAHSDVATELIQNLHSVLPTKRILEVAAGIKDCVVAFPDKGAALRYRPLVHSLEKHPIVALKERNPDTGYLTLKSVEGNVKDENILIVDDICDGGMTFTTLARELYNRGANQVHLYVSHGIFSKGFTDLKEAGIMTIHTFRSVVTGYNRQYNSIEQKEEN